MRGREEERCKKKKRRGREMVRYIRSGRTSTDLLLKLCFSLFRQAGFQALASCEEGRSVRTKLYEASKRSYL